MRLLSLPLHCVAEIGTVQSAQVLYQQKKPDRNLELILDCSRHFATLGDLHLSHVPIAQFCCCSELPPGGVGIRSVAFVTCGSPG